MDSYLVFKMFILRIIGLKNGFSNISKYKYKI